ncbi:MAG: tRNA threonylcarbamoyladenosine dehydratase, partial [Oscillospiraceae bacterium]|nr:tRNA threonylcarbamoyladenosine dehydratase [Oscillospiraceae bacterium]
QLLADFCPDFVIDAVDQVTAKLQLAAYCREAGVANICCLGTGNRLDAAGFTVGDIADTAGCGCPLAKVMRRELKKRGFQKQTVLYSTQPPVETGERTPASISFVPPVAGYLLAGYAVRTLLQKI